ncbi:MAG: hypothetical protein R3B09_35410 [Nannocystaceae bacterium]
MSPSVPVTHVLYLASLLLLIGFGGALLRRSWLATTLAVQVMLLGATLALVGAARIWADVDGHGLALVAALVAAGQGILGAALGLRRAR